MRVIRSLPLLLALLAVASSAHAARGVFLRWDHCYADGGVQNKNFACDTNAGSETLVGGFETNADYPNVSGNEVIINLVSAGSPLPAWWLMRSVGTCRQTALAMNTANSGVNCTDWAAGLSFGGIGAYNIGQRGPNTARLVMALAVQPQQIQSLHPGQEYFSFNVTINHTKTVGPGACAGCSTPVCIVLESINVTTTSYTHLTQGPTNGIDNDWVTWQGGGGIVGIGGQTGCPAATPTVLHTWGEVKALYR